MRTHTEGLEEEKEERNSLHLIRSVSLDFPLSPYSLPASALPCLSDLEVGDDDLEELRRLVTLPPLMSGASFGDHPLDYSQDGCEQPCGPVTSPLQSVTLASIDKM